METRGQGGHPQQQQEVIEDRKPMEIQMIERDDGGHWVFAVEEGEDGENEAQLIAHRHPPRGGGHTVALPVIDSVLGPCHERAAS